MNTPARVSALSCSPSEVLAWSVVVLALGVFFPGAGLLAAVVLSFTRLRKNRTARLVLPVLGVLLLVMHLGVLLPGTSESEIGEPVIVEQ